MCQGYIRAPKRALYGSYRRSYKHNGRVHDVGADDGASAVNQRIQEEARWQRLQNELDWFEVEK